MKSSSAGEHGTMYQLRNLLARTNVNENPQKDFNACDDFFQLIIPSHTLAASLEFLKMESLIDTPSEDDISDSPNTWMNSAEDRVKILTEVCNGIMTSSYRLTSKKMSRSTKIKCMIMVNNC